MGGKYLIILPCKTSNHKEEGKYLIILPCKTSNHKEEGKENIDH